MKPVDRRGQEQQTQPTPLMTQNGGAGMMMQQQQMYPGGYQVCHLILKIRQCILAGLITSELDNLLWYRTNHFRCLPQSDIPLPQRHHQGFQVVRLPLQR